MPPRTRQTLRIAVLGASGRMGREIVALIEAAPDLTLRATPGREAKWQISPGSVDVVVDFSLPGGFRRGLSWCVKNRIAFVSGTTGLGPAEKRALKKAARVVPVLYSANMSLGIAVVNRMLRSFRAVNDWDFHVDEIHHRQKRDRPSGTAHLLDEALRETLGRATPKPNSIRGGGVPGLHQVWALGPEETILLQHTAFNRLVFARGALHAARWLFDKAQPGLYDLSNLFEI